MLRRKKIERGISKSNITDGLENNKDYLRVVLFIFYLSRAKKAYTGFLVLASNGEEKSGIGNPLTGQILYARLTPPFARYSIPLPVRGINGTGNELNGFGFCCTCK